MTNIVTFVEGPVPQRMVSFDDQNGAVVEFYGVVRQEERSSIHGLEYETYQAMATKILLQTMDDLAPTHPCTEVTLSHSVGRVPIGQPSLWVCARAKHRAAALGMIRDLIDGMKRDAPIWKKPY